MIKVGQKVRCKPYHNIRLFDMQSNGDFVDGVVAYVNEDHRWFAVEYGNKQLVRVGFKFNDIGKIVELV